MKYPSCELVLIALITCHTMWELVSDAEHQHWETLVFDPRSFSTSPGYSMIFAKKVILNDLCALSSIVPMTMVSKWR